MKLAQTTVTNTGNLVTIYMEITPTSYKLAIRGQRMSCIAAMSTRGMEDVDIHEGNINGEIFSGFAA